MNNLVIAVSPDSSLELLKAYADVIILDTEPLPASVNYYDTLYIRSHFGQESTLPQNFQTEIDVIVQRAKKENPNIIFIDGVNTVDEIVAIEDKWLQYKRFSEFMPKTQVLNNTIDLDHFEHPILKKRLSSRGNGVTRDIDNVTTPLDEWVIQEAIPILEELRVYVIHGEVYPIGAVRQSMTTEQSTKAITARNLTQDEIDFSTKIAAHAEGMDIIGLDIARTTSGKLNLLEVNRSPGFGAFAKLTDVNLAELLYVSGVEG